MDQWQLVDGSIPVPGPDDFPILPIRSEAQLRAELNRLRGREPGILVLESPEGEALQLGIGGPFAGIRWYRHREVAAVVRAERVQSEKRIDFAAEEDTIAFWPDQLIPVDLAIEVIVFYYNNRRLPDWIASNEWDPVTNQWHVKPAVGAQSA